MMEAKKIDILPAAETLAASQPEANIPDDIFNQLGLLVDFYGFDLGGAVKRSRKIDKQVKKEMLDIIDEARGTLTNSKTDGSNNNLATEAAAYFDILMEMAEKNIPNFEKKLAEHNEAVIAKNSIEPVDVKNDSAQAEQGEEIKNDDVINNDGEPLIDNKKNIMGKEGESLPSGGRTIQEQLAAKKDEIEKIIVSGNPENSTSGQAEQGAEEVVAEKAVEVKPEKKEVKQAPVAKPKEDRIKIVDVAGNQRKAEMRE